VNFAERDFNRKLSVEKVLEKLERWMPEQFKLAEVVGKWIWVTFVDPRFLLVITVICVLPASSGRK